MTAGKQATITRDQTARAAAARMKELHVGSLIVVEDDRPVGIVTDRDLAIRTLGRGRSGETVLVEQVMSTPIQVLGVDASQEEALDLMREHAIRKLPLVDAEGRLAGVIGADDVILRLSRDVFGLAQAMRHELRNEWNPAPSTQQHNLGLE